LQASVLTLTLQGTLGKHNTTSIRLLLVIVIVILIAILKVTVIPRSTRIRSK